MLRRPTNIYLIAFKDINLKKHSRTILIICAIALVFRGGLFTEYIRNQHKNWTNYSAPRGIQNYYSSSKSFCLLGADIYQRYRHKDLLIELYPNDTIYWFDNTIRNTQGVIPHSTLHKVHTITGTSNNIEADSMLNILESNKKDGIYTYHVKFRND